MNYLLTSNNLYQSYSNIELFFKNKFPDLKDDKYICNKIMNTINYCIKKKKIFKKVEYNKYYYHVEWGIKYNGFKTDPCGIIIQGAKSKISLLSKYVNKILIKKYLNYKLKILPKLKKKINTNRNNCIKEEDIIEQWIKENNNIFSNIEQVGAFPISVSSKPEEIYKFVNENIQLFTNLVVWADQEINFLNSYCKKKKFFKCQENIRVSPIINECYERFYNYKNCNKDIYYLLAFAIPNIFSRFKHFEKYDDHIDVNHFFGSKKNRERGIDAAIRELEEESGIKINESFVINNYVKKFKNIFVIELKDNHNITMNNDYITIL